MVSDFCQSLCNPILQPFPAFHKPATSHCLWFPLSCFCSCLKSLHHLVHLKSQFATTCSKKLPLTFPSWVVHLIPSTSITMDQISMNTLSTLFISIYLYFPSSFQFIENEHSDTFYYVLKSWGSFNTTRKVKKYPHNWRKVFQIT